jgi:GT2 family glycosyltransferase
MADGHPLVAIIVVVHNRKKDLVRLLKSLYEQSYPAYDILIIDNGSSDDLASVSLCPSLEYVRLASNIGFVSGMVSGLARMIRTGKYRYFWILDSDLEVAPHALEKLVGAFSLHDRVGVAGCVIHNTYRRDLIVEAGADVCLADGVVSPRHCNEKSVLPDEVIEVDFVASGGGGSLICAEALRATGLHDERYHFLWEDTDFGLCLKRHGYRSLVIPEAVVYHPPFTEKRNPNIYAYYGVRNPLLTVAKYAQGMTLVRYLLGNLARYLRSRS